MRKSIVLIGTFRKEQEKLRRLYKNLSVDFDILCPQSVDFTEPKADYVRAQHELDDDIITIEERLLAAMREADFVWLFAPSIFLTN